MNKRKKIAVIIGLITFGILQTNIILAATGTITTETIRIRAEASTESKIVEIGNLNEKVEVVGEEGDWYKVNFKNKEGYIHKEYLKLDDGEILPTENQQQEQTNENQETNQQEETNQQNQEANQQEETNQTSDNNQETMQQITLGNITNKVTYGYLLPNITSIKVLQINKGVTVKLITTIANWTKIEINENEVWITNNCLALEGEVQTPVEEEPEQPTDEVETPEEPETQQSNSINQEGYISSNASARMRKEPSTESEILRKLPTNTSIIILTEEDGWYKISYNGEEGYISKDLITIGTAPVETSSRSSEEPRKTEEQPQSNSSSGNNIAETAKSFLGGNYVYGGTSPSGFDCSGLTGYVAKQCGYSIPRTAQQQYNQGNKIDKNSIEPGDLVYFSNNGSTNSIYHVGVYIGDGNFVHAANSTRGIVINSLNGGDYYGYNKQFVGATRL